MKTIRLGLCCLIIGCQDKADTQNENEPDTEIEPATEPGSDADEDGVLTEDDCDDSDPELLAQSDDSDCDGIPNSEDSCPDDALNDLDGDGICGSEDPVCNGDFEIGGEDSAEDLLLLSQCSEIDGESLR